MILYPLYNHVMLCDYIWFSLYVGLVETLKHLLVDKNVTIRHKATECLFVIAGETGDITRKHNT